MSKLIVSERFIDYEYACDICKATIATNFIRFFETTGDFVWLCSSPECRVAGEFALLSGNLDYTLYSLGEKNDTKKP